MKDCFDVVEDIKSLINIPAVTSQISGVIYTDEKLSGSDKVDIVINSFSITNTINQVASANVNVYAPNKQVMRMVKFSHCQIERP